MRTGSDAAVWTMLMRQASAILVLGLLSSGRAATQAVDADLHTPTLPSSSSPVLAPPREPVLPANLIVSDLLRPLVSTMWRRSPTFRRQCARLAEHPAVTVRIELLAEMTHRMAEARLARRRRGLEAVVRVAFGQPRMYLEHIAHELEHVLEQVDGTDLRRLARHGLDGIVDMGEPYETARARAVGQAVASETLQ